MEEEIKVNDKVIYDNEIGIVKKIHSNGFYEKEVEVQFEDVYMSISISKLKKVK